MKTVEMLSKAEVDGKTYRSCDLFYSKETNFYGTITEFVHGFYLFNTIMNFNGWKEVIKVSDDEKVILRNLNKKYKWIARDKDSNVLDIYDEKPTKGTSFWANIEGIGSERLKLFNHLFQMVQWEDKEPTLIADLLREV
jgi:hypothetical protein